MGLSPPAEPADTAPSNPTTPEVTSGAPPSASVRIYWDQGQLVTRADDVSLAEGSRLPQGREQMTPHASRPLPTNVEAPTGQWLTDPWNRSQWRYWDGADWSGYTAPKASVTDKPPVTPKPPVAPRPLLAMGAMTLIGTALLASEFTWMPAVWGNGVQVLVWPAFVFLALLATWVFGQGAVGRSGDGHEAMLVALVLSWLAVLAPPLVTLFVVGGLDLT